MFAVLSVAGASLVVAMSVRGGDSLSCEFQVYRALVASTCCIMECESARNVFMRSVEVIALNLHLSS